MMQISGELLKHMRCCVGSDGHIVSEPIMVKCGGNACKCCILEAVNLSLKCVYCDGFHLKSEMLKMPANESIQRLVEKKYLKELVEDMGRKLHEIGSVIENASLEKEIDVKIEAIENEIDTKIGSLVRELYKIRDSFKLDLAELKKKLQLSLMDDCLEQVRLALSDSRVDYEEFTKNQKLLRECQLKLDNFKDELNQVRFHPNEGLINKALIGNLATLDLNYFRPMRSIEVEVQSAGEINRVAFMPSQDLYILADNHSDSLRCVNDGTSFVLSHDRLKQPVALSLDNEENLYVGQIRPSNVLVFNKLLEFQHGFDIHVRVSEISDLAFDPLDSKQQLYVTDCRQNKISIFENGIFTKSIPMQSPRELKFSGETMLVLSNDSILVLNKHSLKVLKEIRLEAGSLAKGLYFDHRHSNIVTTVCTETKHAGLQQRDLIAIDENGNFVLRKELTDLNHTVSSFNFLPGRLVACSEKKLNIIEFF